MNELTKLIETISAIVEKAIDDPRLKKEIGDSVIKSVKKRTRSGKGVENKKEVKLKALKRRTVKTREYKKKRGELSGPTSPPKSNLTESGQMLDSLTKKIGTKVVTIEVKDKKEKVKANQESRPFLDVTEADEQRIANKVATELAALLNKITIG